MGSRRIGMRGLAMVVFAFAALGALGTLAVVLSAGRTPARPEAVSWRAAPEGFGAAIARGAPFAVGVYVDGSAAPRTDRLRPLDAEPSRGDEVDPVPDAVVGAGFVVSRDGLVVTAAHVVAGEGRVVVRLSDERVFVARRVGADPETDVALLRIDASWDEAPPLGESLALGAGDWVLALDEPFGLQRSVTAGVVGGTARHFVEDRQLVFVQTDIVLNPGHSGGPLLDGRGSIVGMNARAIAGVHGMAGMSLTVPIELVLQVVADLRDGTARPRFGARFEDLSPPQALDAGMLRASGAVVRAISADGEARRAGLRSGDIVVGVNGQPVGDSADLATLLLAGRDAPELRLVVRRDGAYRELRAPRSP